MLWPAEGVALCPAPDAARVVGTVTFDDSTQYETLKSWRADRKAHHIEQGSTHDWQGPKTSEMHAWIVGKTRLLSEPIHSGADKTQTGWGSARTLRVKFEAEAAPAPSRPVPDARSQECRMGSGKGRQGAAGCQPR